MTAPDPLAALRDVVERARKIGRVRLTTPDEAVSIFLGNATRIASFIASPEAVSQLKDMFGGVTFDAEGLALAVLQAIAEKGVGND